MEQITIRWALLAATVASAIGMLAVTALNAKAQSAPLPSQEITLPDAILPPLEFDHPYAGKLTIERYATAEESHARCMAMGARVPTAIGCSQHSTTTCTVVIPIKQDLYNSEEMLRHEIGHCNGWPNDHPGIRRNGSPPAIGLSAN